MHVFCSFRCRQLIVISFNTIYKRYAIANISFHKLNSSISCHNAEQKLSYFHKVGEEPLQYITLGKMLERSVNKWPDRKAFISLQEQVSLTYSDFLQKVDELAAALKEIGLERGDRVGIWAPNCWQWQVISFAVNRAGLILVSINPIYEKTELEQCIKKVEIKGLITLEKHAGRDCYRLINELIPDLRNQAAGQIVSERLPSLRTIVVISENDLPGVFNYTKLTSSVSSTSVQKVSSEQDSVQPEEPCIIQFTSGTTGDPKAVVVSHMSVANAGILVGKRQQYQLGLDTVCVQLPFFHMFSTIYLATPSIEYGSTILLPSITYNPKAVYEALHSKNCTIIHGTPTMFVDLMGVSKSLSLGPPPALRVLLTGGSSCSPYLIRSLEKEFGIPKALIAYGMTENSAVCSCLSIDDKGKEGYETIGQPHSHVETKVIDENGRTVPLGEAGELCVKNYGVMQGYWKDEKRTKEVLGLDGWLKTGDKVKMMENGYMKIIGRIKDVIIRGGENIYPKEIEDVINTHENILEAHVFGVPHERLGEEVCVAVRLKDGTNITYDDMQRFCDKKIAMFKIPKRLKVVQTFPKSATGKIQKFKLTNMVTSGEL